MIPDKYAELLNLPPAASVEEAQSHCQQLLERLRQNIDALPAEHQIQPELDNHKKDLELVLAYLEEQTQSALEKTLDQGMSCLMQKPPDYAGAGKFYAAAERAAAGKDVPALLKRRMQVFKQTLDEARTQVLRGKIADTLKRISSLLAQEPPGIAEAREKLGLVASALRQAPDPGQLADFENLRKAFQEHEKRFAHPKPEVPKPATVEVSSPAPPTTNAAAEQAAAQAPRPAPSSPATPKPPEPIEEVTHASIDKVAESAVALAPPHPSENCEETPAGAENPAIEKSQTASEFPPPSAPPPDKAIPKTIPLPKPDAVEPRGKSKKSVPALAAIMVLALIGIVYVGYAKFKSSRNAIAANPPHAQIARQTSAPSIAQTPPASNPAPALPPTNPPVAVAPVVAPPARPVPPSEMGELTIDVKPDGADLFTNGVSLGHPHYPVVLRGESQREVALRASLDGYASESITLVFPSHGAEMRQTFELQPNLPVLLVRSEPATAEVSLQRPGGKAVKVKAAREGIGFTPGVPVNVTIELPGYETATVQVPALKPGERREVAFGKLRLRGGRMCLKSDPPDAQFTVIYPGKAPVRYGAVPVIDGILPGVDFRLIAERAGYAPQTNWFSLKDQEVRDYDFGRLKPLPATLLVSASPQPFNLKVAWDMYTRDCGATGRAAELPARKNLAVTVSAPGHETLATNVTLEGGETRKLILGALEPLRENVIIKTDTDAAEVSYTLDKGAPVALGVTNRITGVPFGSALVVKLHKEGFVARTLEIKKVARGSETLDFGRLTPATVTAVSAAEVDQAVRDTTAGIDTVKVRLPLTDASRQNWIDWIRQIEVRYKDNAEAWARLGGPIEQLRELVNTSKPIPHVPVMGSPLEP
jgi:hypothetical protein